MFGKQSGIVVELLKDLGATERQIERFYRGGKLEEESYAELKMQIAAEKSGTNTNILTDQEQMDPLSGNAVLNGIPVTVEVVTK